MLVHVCPAEQVVFINSDKMDKTVPITLISGFSQSWLLNYVRGDMDSLNPEFALYSSVLRLILFFPLSQVSTGAVTIGKNDFTMVKGCFTMANRGFSLLHF